MRSLLPLILFALFIGCFTQHGGIARMQELKTKVDPIRSFDLPDEAPRARIIATDFLTRGNRKMKKPFKDDSRQEDFRRWKLDELTDRDMRSSKEVKSSVRSPFTKDSGSEEDEHVGDFFPSKRV
ncbi:FMRF-Like Peptide [Caenorhabditis elegans]|uniref:FMRF-Like Peptide n=1 Tax=Caenorhabditis elegans TaxID=6239 RepID=Q7YTS6_CAEEL|nr:FMRF-Like Peptide [Caenorhabditis elegans]CAE17690.1 FMRF-Like Peptide [Caenorhabditis elegans]|eukprot:NP_001021894.1 Uncharacterized protein CELE_B0334.13 [Caenorhabditis elegans]